MRVDVIALNKTTSCHV